MSCFTILHTHNWKVFLSRRNVLVLLVWIFGLLAGCYCGSQTPDFVFSLMRTSFSERVSIVWRLTLLLFPLILSVTALRLSMPLLVLPVVFVKAYSFFYSLYCLNYAFGSAGWLVSFIFFFSDSCSIFVFLYFVLSHAVWESGKCLRDFVISAFLLIALGIFDYFVVSPFGVELLKY